MLDDLDAWKCRECDGEGLVRLEREGIDWRDIVITKEHCDACDGIGWQGPDAALAAKQGVAIDPAVVLWQAMNEAEKVGNRTDDKLIVKFLRRAGYCIAAAPAPEAQPRSQRLADAGFTARDTRLECDECGAKVSAQMLPIHKCEAQAAGQELPPVDFICEDHDSPWLICKPCAADGKCARAALAQRQPLTVHQIAMLPIMPGMGWVEIVRVVEQRHGIGATTGEQHG